MFFLQYILGYIYITVKYLSRTCTLYRGLQKLTLYRQVTFSRRFIRHLFTYTTFTSQAFQTHLISLILSEERFFWDWDTSHLSSTLGRRIQQTAREFEDGSRTEGLLQHVSRRCGESLQNWSKKPTACHPTRLADYNRKWLILWLARNVSVSERICAHGSTWAWSSYCQANPFRLKSVDHSRVQ